MTRRSPRHPSRSVLLVVVALVVVGTLPWTAGGAARAVLASGTVRGVLRKDTVAKSKMPDTNFGAEADLQASGQPGYAKVTFLQFSVTGIPAGSVATSAQLRLRSKTTATERAVSARPVPTTDWTEAGLTWSNQPAMLTAISTVADHTAGADSTWPVGSWVNNNGEFALALDSAYPSDTTFTSEEGGLAPVLIVTFAAAPIFNVYRGNTHSHTTYTSSHGLKPPDNGPPNEHHARAKAAGFDFYVTTDHSQEVAFEPTGVNNPAWVDTKRAAAEASDPTYLGLAGFEHSENNGGPNPGQGHINVINSNAYLDALEKGIDLPFLYRWLATAAPNGSGLPVVASFNHPGVGQYREYGYRTDAVTDIITMIELINGARTSYESSYREANNYGWKVAPTVGLDNHAFWGITNLDARVGVLATGRTKAEILDAMKNRRTFASYDRNLTLRYTANGLVMGSTLSKPPSIKFVITADDPDTSDEGDRLTLLEIVDPFGQVVASTTLSGYSTVWTPPAIPVLDRKYFYVRVTNAGSGNVPMAWAAPVWTSA
jgi:hypothetical protein